MRELTSKGGYMTVLDCIVTVLTVYCVWFALASHTVHASGKYTSAVMCKRWRSARWLAYWHGGEPKQYISAVMRGYNVLQTPSARWCWLLLDVDVQLGFYVWRVML